VNVVDSCGWLEYFTRGPNAEFFKEPIRDLEHLIVPTISLYEVFKSVMRQKGQGDAERYVALMREGRVIELDAPLAMYSARTSAENSLPMADAIILATAQAFDATLWTQDADFEGMYGVEYVRAQ
jgi:predicted nucleic acid-binding protein